MTNADKSKFRQIAKLLPKANKYDGNLPLYYADEVIIFALEMLKKENKYGCI